jgi:hypothetical protein
MSCTLPPLSTTRETCSETPPRSFVQVAETSHPAGMVHFRPNRILFLRLQDRLSRYGAAQEWACYLKSQKQVLGIGLLMTDCMWAAWYLYQRES